MNSMLPIETRPSGEIATAVFLMFVYVADIDKNITAQEVKRFQSLLKDVAWIDNPQLRDAIQELQANYSLFWADYEDGRLVASPDAIARCLSKTLSLISEDQKSFLLRDLTRFLERLEGGAYGARLVQGEQRTRLLTRRELLKSFREDPRPESREQAAAPSSAGTKAQTLLNSNSAVQSQGGIVWQGGKTKVRCVSVVAETHDTKTYSFAAEPPVLFHYKPGQFVTIEIPLPGSTLRRSYTISSSPSRPYLISITVKKVPLGWMSNWLYENMAPGVECMINGPSGKFNCVDHPADKILFLAAGSGITPCMSMLRWLVDTARAKDIVFINNVRTPSDIIFHQELLHLATRLGEKMKLAFVPVSMSPGQPWHGPTGKLDEALIRAYAPDFIQREVFTCGPAGYMDAAKNMLASMGFPLAHFHSESFGPPAAPSKPALSPSSMSIPEAPAPIPATDIRAAPLKVAVTAPLSKLPPLKETPLGVMKAEPAETRSAPSAGTARVTILGGGGFDAEPDVSILDAAEASGTILEHSCRSGACGSCKMRKLAGHVDMENPGALSDEEIAAGFILTCVGRAKGNVTLAPL